MKLHEFTNALTRNALNENYHVVDLADGQVFGDFDDTEDAISKALNYATVCRADAAVIDDDNNVVKGFNSSGKCIKNCNEAIDIDDLDFDDEKKLYKILVDELHADFDLTEDNITEFAIDVNNNVYVAFDNGIKLEIPMEIFEEEFASGTDGSYVFFDFLEDALEELDESLNEAKETGKNYLDELMVYITEEPDLELEDEQQPVGWVTRNQWDNYIKNSKFPYWLSFSEMVTEISGGEITFDYYEAPFLSEEQAKKLVAENPEYLKFKQNTTESLNESDIDARPNHSKFLELLERGLLDYEILAEDLLRWLPDSQLGELLSMYGLDDYFEDETDSSIYEAYGPKKSYVVEVWDSSTPEKLHALWEMFNISWSPIKETSTGIVFKFEGYKSDIRDAMRYGKFFSALKQGKDLQHSPDLDDLVEKPNGDSLKDKDTDISIPGFSVKTWDF